MEALWYSKMLVSYHITVQHHNSEDHKMNLHHCKNLKCALYLLQFSIHCFLKIFLEPEL